MNFFIGFILGGVLCGWMIGSVDRDVAIKHGAARWVLLKQTDNTTEFKWNDELDKDTPH